MVTIRAGSTGDGEALRRIERAAGERFRGIGMAWVADDEPLSVEELAGYALDGRCWVACDGDEPVGYALAEVVDGCTHLAQMSVVPEHQGTGVGQALLQAVKDWATAHGHPAVTLTTFADVPWNRPLYEHLGFRVLDASGIGPGLQEVRERETAQGLDPALRVCMRLDL